MARRKKAEEAELEAKTNDNAENDEAEEAEAVAELEAQEAEALEATEEEKAEADAEEKAPAKPRRRRAPRKKPEAPANALASLATAAQPEAAEEKEEAAAKPEEETAEEPAKPKRAPRKAKAASETEAAAEENHLREDAEVAEVSIHKSMDSMVKQWASVKEISSSVCVNLEKVAGLLGDLEGDYSSAQSALAKESRKKSSTVAKVAAGMSGFALLLSILSFSLAQSLRHSVLEANASKAATVASVPAMPEAALNKTAMSRKETKGKELAATQATRVNSAARKDFLKRK